MKEKMFKCQHKVPRHTAEQHLVEQGSAERYRNCDDVIETLRIRNLLKIMDFVLS
jgi:hypothetical protein